jgi:hypothetical protein
MLSAIDGGTCSCETRPVDGGSTVPAVVTASSTKAGRAGASTVAARRGRLAQRSRRPR